MLKVVMGSSVYQFCRLTAEHSLIINVSQKNTFKSESTGQLEKHATY